MKKTIITSAIALIITGAAFAQPVSDRGVIPIGITLNQILRLHITDGGNIEFVFNSINDYNNGIANMAAFNSKVVIASSTDWQIHMGSETATMEPSDATAASHPAIAINNVQFMITWTGSYLCGAAAAGNNVTTAGTHYTNALTVANGLALFTGVLATDGLLMKGALLNGGDIAQNAFTINWQCSVMPVVGVGAEPCAATSMLAQSPSPDRYTTNVILDLEAI